MHITGLELQTADLIDQALFYGEILGLETHIIARTQVIARAGATELVFTQADGGQRSLYHSAFNIPENQLGIIFLRDVCLKPLSFFQSFRDARKNVRWYPPISREPKDAFQDRPRDEVS